MDFLLSEEQAMLKQMARDFLEKECPESFVREIEADDDGYSPDIWRKIAELGWLGLVYPEKYGGAGGSLLDLTVLYEEMGQAMFPSPHLSAYRLGYSRGEADTSLATVARAVASNAKKQRGEKKEASPKQVEGG